MGDAWTRGRGAHESETVSRGTRLRWARGREDSPRRDTVSMRTRGRNKQTSPDFCALCVKYNFLWCPERYFIKLLWEPEKSTRQETKEKNPKMDFAFLVLNRSIQDLSDHGASNEPKNPLPEWIPMTHHDPRNLGLICLVKKR